MKKLFSLVSILAMLLAGCGQNQPNGATAASADTTAAQETVTATERDPDMPASLIVGVADVDLPPHTYTDRQGDALTGFEVDLINAIAERLDIKVTLLQIAQEELESALDHRKIDAILGNISCTNENKLAMALTNPYITIPQVLITRTDSLVTAMEDLSGKNIAVVMDTPAARLTADNYFEVTFGVISSPKDWLIPINELSDGTVSAIVADGAMAQYMLERLGDGYAVSPNPVAEVDYSIALRREDDKPCLTISRAIDEMYTDGTLSALSEKWFGKDYYSR